MTLTSKGISKKSQSTISMRNACLKDQFPKGKPRKSSKIRKLRKSSFNTSKIYACIIRHVKSTLRWSVTKKEKLWKTKWSHNKTQAFSGLFLTNVSWEWAIRTTRISRHRFTWGCSGANLIKWSSRWSKMKSIKRSAASSLFASTSRVLSSWSTSSPRSTQLTTSL